MGQIILPRNQHTSTRLDDATPKQATRILKNYANYRNVDSLDINRQLSWQVTGTNFGVPSGTPDHWPDSFDFHLQAQNQPLQVYISTANSDLPTSTAIRVRLSDRPHRWVQYKVVNPAPNVTPIQVGRSVIWPGIFGAGRRLKWTANKAGVEKLIELNSEPTHWPRFSVRQPPGCTFEISPNLKVIRFKGSSGNVYMQTNPVSGWWGNEDPEEATDQGQVNIVEADTIVDGLETLRTFRLVPVGAAWDSAVYPIYLDPTTTISGTTDIEDTHVRSDNNTLNYSASYNFVGYWQFKQTIVRIVSAGSIPSSAITGFRFLSYNHLSNAVPSEAYFIKDANNWVHSTATWDVKSTGQAWAGGNNGCGASGTDYVADGSPPTLSFAAGWNTYTLPIEWPPLWKSGANALNGIVIIPTVYNGNQAYVTNTEDATYPLYFEIDYLLSGHSFFLGIGF